MARPPAAAKVSVKPPLRGVFFIGHRKDHMACQRSRRHETAIFYASAAVSLVVLIARAGLPACTAQLNSRAFYCPLRGGPSCRALMTCVSEWQRLTPPFVFF